MKPSSLVVLLTLLLATLFVMFPAKADSYTYSPLYQFNGVITVTGTNPTCGASPGPCQETIDLSFAYFYAIPPGFTIDSGEAAVVIASGGTVTGEGPLGTSAIWDENFERNYPTFYYSEIHFPGFPSLTEIDLNVDAVDNTFWAETYFCNDECETLFGGYHSVGSVPASLTYTVSQVPEPTSTLLLCAGGVLLALVSLFTNRFYPTNRRSSS